MAAPDHQRRLLLLQPCDNGIHPARSAICVLQLKPDVPPIDQYELVIHHFGQRVYGWQVSADFAGSEPRYPETLVERHTRVRKHGFQAGRESPMLTALVGGDQLGG